MYYQVPNRKNIFCKGGLLSGSTKMTNSWMIHEEEGGGVQKKKLPMTGENT